METLATPHLRINKILLNIVGQWPHQPKVAKTICYCLMLFFTSTQAYLQIAGMICARNNIDLFLESIPTVLVDFTCAAKIFNFFYNGDKMKQLLLILEDDWRNVKTYSEAAILNKYSLFARKLTLMYCGALYGTMTPFLLIPLVPIIHNFIATQNDSISKQLMFEQVDYLLDTEKYYYPLFIHGYCGTLAFLTVVVAIDTMFMVYVEHACAIFAVVG
ncbi:uncharacterized protein LOC107040295 [Diachasma alloeum]|uniref:Odorant receptor 130CTE n=1 Tax=Diachasma alloeum TaxID=454923 RepID=A0A4E0RT11_9HYME|nr:uncharacterized protein LOC107040295 [Diachasma alloeum]THK33087.1 odorant receptor 130CTE [Diachasma alloeum]